MTLTHYFPLMDSGNETLTEFFTSNITEYSENEQILQASDC